MTDGVESSVNPMTDEGQSSLSDLSRSLQHLHGISSLFAGSPALQDPGTQPGLTPPALAAQR